MLHETDPKIIYSLPDHERFNNFTLIKAVYTGLQKGRVYVDSDTNPKVIFVMNKSGFSYLDADSTFTDYKGLIKFFTEEKNIPVYFHIYEPPAGLMKYVEVTPEEVGYKFRGRLMLYYKEKIVDCKVPANNENIQVSEITKENITAVKALRDGLISSYWASDEDFLENSFGTTLIENGVPVAVCYSACTIDDRAEMDLYTSPACLNRGLGRYVASLMMQQSRDRDLYPIWDTLVENTASLNMGLKIGVVLRREYDFLSLFLKNKVNENK